MPTILIAVLLSLDGQISRAAALDRWVGTAVFSEQGATFAVDFTVLVDPGRGASWEWRFQGVQLGSGPLAASVSGSTVNGTLFITGGAGTQVPGCCRPCDFNGVIIGNQVNGTLDSASCSDSGGSGTFTLVKR
jgi:hypothetical protein